MTENEELKNKIPERIVELLELQSDRLTPEFLEELDKTIAEEKEKLLALSFNAADLSGAYDGVVPIAENTIERLDRVLVVSTPTSVEEAPDMIMFSLPLAAPTVTKQGVVTTHVMSNYVKLDSLPTQLQQAVRACLSIKNGTRKVSIEDAKAFEDALKKFNIDVKYDFISEYVNRPACEEVLNNDLAARTERQAL